MAAGHVLLYDRSWILMNFPRYPSIGKFEAERFRVMAFTDEEIRAIVKAGRLTDAKAEDYLVRCIIHRVDPDGALHFQDLAVSRGFRQPPPGYIATWYTFRRSAGGLDLVGVEREE